MNTEAELALAQAIPGLLRRLGMLPDGYQYEVHLYRGDRKKRRNARFDENWDPWSDSIRVVFAPMKEALESATSPGMANLERTDDRLSDLIRALDHAERCPHHQFVSIKWFRDTALVRNGFSWAADQFARRDILRDAIDRRWILTSKVANLRPSLFPVTAIQLNRQIPEVNAVLGGHAASLLDACPVSVREAPLPAHDRR